MSDRKLSVLVLIASFILLFLNPQSVHADDDFIYGVQIFNRPIDWTNPYDPSELSAGAARVRKLLTYADDLGVNLIRGGTTADNVSDHNAVDPGVLRGMNALLPMLAEHNMILDWVLVGTAERDRDNSTSAIIHSGPDYAIPPLTANWSKLISLSARTARTHNANVIYEIWNEPDLSNGDYRPYWRGSESRYWDSLLSDALAAIHFNDRMNAPIINGGLVLGGGEASYMTRAIEELKAGNISMLAIHAHDSFNQFMRLIENENLSGRGVNMQKVFLNECGYAWGTEGGKEFNIAAKILGAKALGFGGITVFHLGGMTASELTDTIERGSQLITLNNGTLTPTDMYYAVRAAIGFTKGLKPVDSYNDVRASDEGYVWLFRSEDGTKKTLACIGKSPTESEIAGAFGTEAYEVRDISGNVMTGSRNVGKYDVVYYVSGFNYDPKPAVPNENPDEQTSNRTVGKSGGGCNAGLGIVSALMLIAFIK